MALNIKDPETDRLARQLAELTGESITTAIKTAVAARLDSVNARQTGDVARRLALIDEIAARGRARPILDDRSEDEILGYDEHGIPS